MLDRLVIYSIIFVYAVFCLIAGIICISPTIVWTYLIVNGYLKELLLIVPIMNLYFYNRLYTYITDYFTYLLHVIVNYIYSIEE